MRIQSLLLSSVLLICSGCGLTPSQNLKLPPTVAPSCPLLAYLACPAPIVEKDPTMGTSEMIDSQNRQAWLQCILAHNAALECLNTLENARVIAPRVHP